MLVSHLALAHKIRGPRTHDNSFAKMSNMASQSTHVESRARSRLKSVFILVSAVVVVVIKWREKHKKLQTCYQGAKRGQ